MSEPLISSTEGRLLAVGLALSALMLLAFGIGWQLFPDHVLTYAAMTGLNLVIGRAAGMSFGYASGFGHAQVVPINMLVETIQVLVVYPLFALSWRQLIRLPRLEGFLTRLHRAAASQSGTVCRFGIAGLFVFVFLPFWMTGPVVGSIIGFLIGLRPWVNMGVVLVATYVAIGVWALLLNELSAWAATFNHFAPYALFLAIVLIAVAMYLLHRRRDSPADDMPVTSPFSPTLPMTNMPPFQAFTGLYEPSAIQQLPDGRFLVVEDEKAHPFSLVSIGLDGRVQATPLLPPEGVDDAVWKLDDLEALALGPAGWVYALTSHSRSGSGEVKKARDKLVRFRVEGGRMAAPSLVRELKPALVAAHPALAAAAEILEVKDEGGLNIEALEITPDGQALLVGFRGPLLEGKAIIARVENPAALFEAGEAPRISPALITLDLGGCGLRGMAWVPALGGHLLISGPVARQQVPFRLWCWSGRPEEGARPVRVEGREGFEHAEGVTPALIDGQARIVIVSDDGSREEGRYAHFLLLDPAQVGVEG